MLTGGRAGGWTDIQTNMMKLIVSFRNFAKIPKERLDKLVSMCRIVGSLSMHMEKNMFLSQTKDIVSISN